MSNIFDVPRARINGSMLSQHQGKPVCLLGQVVQLDQSGRSFKLKTSDNQTVTVQMSEPLQECLEGLVEVQGLVSQYNTISCKHYIMFPRENAESLDMNLYNEAIQLMARYPNHYITS